MGDRREGGQKTRGSREGADVRRVRELKQVVRPVGGTLKLDRLLRRWRRGLREGGQHVSGATHLAREDCRCGDRNKRKN